MFNNMSYVISTSVASSAYEHTMCVVFSELLFTLGPRLEINRFSEEIKRNKNNYLKPVVL